MVAPLRSGHRLSSGWAEVMSWVGLPDSLPTAAAQPGRQEPAPQVLAPIALASLVGGCLPGCRAVAPVLTCHPLAPHRPASPETASPCRLAAGQWAAGHIAAIGLLSPPRLLARPRPGHLRSPFRAVRPPLTPAAVSCSKLECGQEEEKRPHSSLEPGRRGSKGAAKHQKGRGAGSAAASRVTPV